ncbi:MAG: aldo/keto reductase, partial [Sporichthyaceae bacterium]
MEQRALGRTGRQVSVVGLGCWQLGADWGDVGEDDAMAVLNAALDAGVTFLDTADVYGDGRSEKLVGRALRDRGDHGITVATKMGRRADPFEADAFTLDAFRGWLDRSRRNLGVDTIDLVQLHCPPTAVYSDDAVYDALDRLVADQVVSAYGVSVETVDEALTAIARPHVATVQIILNAFRRKPLERVLPAAQEAGVGIIARVPLASGLLSGKYDESTTFADDDHRTYNRDGEAFDVGETFSGVPYGVGVRAAQQIALFTPQGATTAQLALRWIVDQPGVSTVIPGARNAGQAR